MSQEEHLIQLFNELSNQSSQNIGVVTNEIQEFMKNQDSIFLLYQISSTNDNPTIRRCSMIFMRQYLKPISDNVDKIESDKLTYLIPLKEKLLNMLVNEPIPQLKNSICDIIEVYAVIIISISTWPELYQFAINILQDSNQHLLALYLMYCIYPVYTLNMSEEDENIFFFPYSTLAVSSLMSENDEVRIQAIDCVSSIIWEIKSDDDVLQFPNLMEILKTASERAVLQYSNGIECAKLFSSLFETVFYDRFTQYNQYLPAFCEFALNVMQNPGISLDIKIKCHQILNEGPRVIPEYFTEKLNLYLSATLELSVNVCEYDREMPDYQFCHAFLCSLSSNLSDDDNENFYGTFIQYVNSLFQKSTPASIQVALFSLSCIVQACSDSILEEPDLIVEIMMKGIQSEDLFIIDASNDLLLSLIENVSACLSNNLDDIVKVYATKLNDLQFLQTLSSLLAYSDHPPSDLHPLINILLQLLSSQNNSINSFKSDIVQCIKNSISHASVDESLYQMIAPHLIALINQDPTLINDVFDCFGSLLVISPSSIMNDVQTIMQIVFANGTQNQGCANTLLAFIENLPISMAPFIDSTIQFCSSILSKDVNEFISNNDIFEINEDGDFDERLAKLANSRCPAIKMMSYLMPNETYVEYAVSMLKSILKREQFDSATSIVNSAQSLFQSKIDPSKLLSTLFYQLYNQEDSMIAAEMISAIDALISAYPSRYIAENAKEISQLILKTMNEDIFCFLTQESKQSVEEKIMQPLFMLLNHFIEALGPNFVELLPIFQEKLCGLSKGKSRNLRGYATEMLAQIAVTLQSLDILQVSLSSIMLNIKLKHVYLRINIFNAFRIVLRNMELWKEHEHLLAIINQIQNSAREVLLPILSSVVCGNSESKELFESAAALWARCVIAFNWSELSPKDAASVFSKVDSLFDNDDGKSVDLAELLFLYSNDQNSWNFVSPFAVKIAIRIFIQSEWNFQRTPKAILEFAKNILVNNEDTAKLILINVGFNERKQKIITDRLN